MQSNWININDKLPEEHERVLVWVEGHGMLIDNYSFSGSKPLNAFRYAWAWGYHKNVTHWMPLPPKPARNEPEMK